MGDEFKKGVKGKPFMKGHDPRRGPAFTVNDPRTNKHGQINKAAVSFGKKLRDMLVEEGLTKTSSINGESKERIKRVVERIYDEAEVGEAWAVQLIFDRVDGKVTQPIDGIGDISVIVMRGASMDEL